MVKIVILFCAFFTTQGIAFFIPWAIIESSSEEVPPLRALNLKPGEKIRVVATTTFVRDIVKNVGDNRIELSGLMPIDADPHVYQPTPRDMGSVANAHVVFSNGFGFEEFLKEMIRNSGTNAPVVSVSAGIQGRTFSGVSEDGNFDPHTWTDPNNVMVWVRNIEKTLSKLDPQNASTYHHQAEVYTDQLKVIDKEIREGMVEILPAKRILIVDHHVFGYFADRYGLKTVGAVVNAYSTTAEPSAKELAQLQDTVKREGVGAIFVGINLNPRISEQMARDTGIKMVPLYTGSLSDSKGPAKTYLEYMRYNLEAIVLALR